MFQESCFKDPVDNGCEENTNIKQFSTKSGCDSSRFGEKLVGNPVTGGCWGNSIKTGLPRKVFFFFVSFLLFKENCHDSGVFAGGGCVRISSSFTSWCPDGLHNDATNHKD